MGVTIRIPKILQNKTNGAGLVTVQGTTVCQCFRDLTRQYPGLEGTILDSEGRVLLQWMVYINDQMANRGSDVSTQLKEGDCIQLVPLVAGG